MVKKYKMKYTIYLQLLPLGTESILKKRKNLENVEFGCWLDSDKVIYGRPNNASKIKYLDQLYKLDYGKVPYEDLQSLLEASVELISDLYDEQMSEILLLGEGKMIKSQKCEGNDDLYKIMKGD